MITAWVVRNHNGTLIAWDVDLGNVSEEMMVYEEVTGNRTSINKETFEKEPKRNSY
jgi:hypothetical protein